MSRPRWRGSPARPRCSAAIVGVRSKIETKRTRRSGSSWRSSRIALWQGGPFVAWPFTITSFRNPDPCAQRPTSRTTAVIVVALSESVPGQWSVWPSEHP